MWTTVDDAELTQPYYAPRLNCQQARNLILNDTLDIAPEFPSETLYSCNCISQLSLPPFCNYHWVQLAGVKNLSNLDTEKIMKQFVAGMSSQKLVYKDLTS